MNISKDQFDRIKAECVSDGIERGRREEKAQYQQKTDASPRVQEILALVGGLLSRGLSLNDTARVAEEAIKAWQGGAFTGNRRQERE